MMSHPTDIPSDIWDAAVAATHYEGVTLDEAIARAIMAERERCAKIAFMRAANAINPYCSAEAHSIAAAILGEGA